MAFSTYNILSSLTTGAAENQQFPRALNFLFQAISLQLRLNSTDALTDTADFSSESFLCHPSVSAIFNQTATTKKIVKAWLNGTLTLMSEAGANTTAIEKVFVPCIDEWVDENALPTVRKVNFLDPGVITPTIIGIVICLGAVVAFHYFTNCRYHWTPQHEIDAALVNIEAANPDQPRNELASAELSDDPDAEAEEEHQQVPAA